ncbi:hypothetical protein [Thalassotalea aquiviva]|uniref:hypothetical protein n=1 Tax=Thalassotalea aquiviva TaxID=3242415 RepID=UPI00352A4BFE
MTKANLTSELTQKAFMPKLALDFATLIEKQAKPVYEQMGLVIPVISSSVVVFIFERQSAPLLDIARGLGITHQLAAQRVKALLKLNIISAHKDKRDNRKTNYQLTEFGIAQSAILFAYLKKANDVFEDLNEEFGVDLMTLLAQVNQSFKMKSLAQRIFKVAE